MPDWNPAEIVGVRPNLLSLTLYQYLICDEIWAKQRAEYGYVDVRPQPLLSIFAGRPYVNVQASMSSFIPATISRRLGHKLVDHYLDRLVSNPELHDKVEFDIAFTCVSLDFHQRAQSQLVPAGFLPEEIEELRRGLVDVTRTGIDRYSIDLAKIKMLQERFSKVMQQDLVPLHRACILLEDCREYGTLAFAHLARGGFVAMTLLNSAVADGHIGQDFLEEYLESISTVAKEFVKDSAKLRDDMSAWTSFLEKFGHLRPGTYDILSPTYQQQESVLREHYVSKSAVDADSFTDAVAPEWPENAWNSIQARLAELGLKIDLDEFDAFCRAVIEGREYAKFVFTRNLSQALEDIAAFANQAGVTRDDIAGLPVSVLFSLRSGICLGETGKYLKGICDLYGAHSAISQNAELPPLLHDSQQFHAFHYPQSRPNFIGSSSIVAALHVQVDNSAYNVNDVEGRIVLIPQADPGFDWLFSCGIVGLITTFGGANSHMAIRCAEFGIPAAIGVGEMTFENLRNSNIVSLDCSKNTIQIVS